MMNGWTTSKNFEKPEVAGADGADTVAAAGWAGATVMVTGVLEVAVVMDGFKIYICLFI